MTRIAAGVKRHAAVAVVALAILTPASTPAVAGPPPPAFGGSGFSGISARRWSEENRFAKSGRMQYLELRNDADESIWFRVTVWLPNGDRRTWDVAQLGTGQVRQISIDASGLQRFVIENVQSETERRRLRAAGKPLWKTADVIFPKGTTSVRFHLDDPYTYSDDRRVQVALNVVGNAVSIAGPVTANFGWAPWVYPDAYEQRTHKSNARFYFGVGQFGGDPVTDGAVWELEIRGLSSEKADFFGFKGLDGTLIIELPKVPTGQKVTFKAGVGGKTRIRFAVSPE